jgi:predicted RNA binding protein YcfA (HicA-like mRNA interferase family)
MGRRKYPPLTPSETVAIVTALGFHHKKTVGSHAHYERLPKGRFPTAVVTVDTQYKEFDDDLITTMIDQSRHTRDEFYCATKSTAKKAEVPPYSFRAE